MGNHNSADHKEPEAHIEFADCHYHGHFAHSKIPHTTKGKQLICIAGYAWSPQYDRVKAIVDALAHEFPDKYEAWFFETNYVHYCIPQRRKEFGDDYEIFDRLPLCWIQYDDGSNKVIGGRNRFAAWVIRNEKGSKAAMAAVFLEISDGLRHAAPKPDEIAMSQAHPLDLTKAIKGEDNSDSEDEELDSQGDLLAQDESATPEIYRRMMDLITAKMQQAPLKDQSATENMDDPDELHEVADANAAPMVPVPAAIPPVQPKGDNAEESDATDEDASSEKETAGSPMSLPEDNCSFALPRRPPEPDESEVVEQPQQIRSQKTKKHTKSPRKEKASSEPTERDAKSLPEDNPKLESTAAHSDTEEPSSTKNPADPKEEPEEGAKEKLRTSDKSKSKHSKAKAKAKEHKGAPHELVV